MRGTHRRNTGPMLASPRCGAKTCLDGRCMAPAVRGKLRCRMHGGAPGSGAPLGNQNALKHGARSKAALRRRVEMRELFGETAKLLQSYKR